MGEYLTKILKEDWKFDGVLISDWGGAHNTVQCVENGLDMEFGTNTDGLARAVDNAYDSYHLAQPYLELLRTGQADESVLDEKVRRVLRLQMRTNLAPDQPYGRFTCPEHSLAARRIGSESIVLLKNDGNILPLSPELKKILVVGENAVRIMTTKGGSSALKTKYEVTPLQGLLSALPDAEISYIPGYSSTEVSDPSDAVSAASVADAVIFFGGLNKDRKQDAESDDRIDYSLPYGQDALISALAAVNSNVVVVNISGNAVGMPWAEEVRAIVQSWYLGSESGNCIADVLTGKVNPGGKLPFTIPVRLEDGPVRTAEQYPGIPRGDPEDSNTVWDEYYSEDIYVGYRWYGKMGIRPLYAFGYGLSYTDFRISDVKMRGRKVTCRVENTGDRPGAEVVQMYVSLPGDDRPLRELKAFRKVYLLPGESEKVTFTLKDESLMQYEDGWKILKGRYVIGVGTSSEDIVAEMEYNN